MAEPPPRGRGRAALYGKIRAESKDQNLVGQEVPTPPSSLSSISFRSVEDDISKPRGRGALFRQMFSKPESVATSSDNKTDTNLSFETGTYMSGSTSGSSGESDTSKRKGLGRAAIYGIQRPQVHNIIEETRTFSIQEHEKVGISPFKNGEQRTKSEKDAPVIMHGEQGKKVPATVNYIRLEFLDRDKGIYEYEVTFKPDIECGRQKLFLINQHFRTFGGKVKIFDMGQRLFTPDKLINDVNSVTSNLRSGMEVEMTLTYKRMKKFNDCRNILNIIFKRIMNDLHLVKFGRSNYNPEFAHTIPQYKLEIWPGCITAVDEYEGGIALCCEASHRVLRNETCLEIMVDIMRMSNNENWKKDMSTVFIGISVITNYNKKVMKIDDIDFDANPTCTFQRGDTEISYLDYYKNQYNIEIKDKKQPLLVHRAKRKPLGKENVDVLVYLVPELCSPTGLTDDMRSNFKLMKEVTNLTCISPLKRQTALREFIRGIKNNEKANSYLVDWNLKLPDTTMELTARILEPERIFFGGNRSVQEVNADWGRAAANNHVISPIDLNEWAIIFTSRDSRVTNQFLETLRDVGRKIGMYIGKPQSVPIPSDQTKNYCEQIKRLYNGKVQIIVMIFPTNRDDRYASVKKLCNSDLGIASQVINSKTISNPKNLRSVVTKIVLQMNCKVGGALWGVSIPYQEQGVMFCGIDAYHDALHKNHSIIALVTSMNYTCTRWASGTSIHNRGQEITDVIVSLFRDSLEMWHKTNNSFPSRIVIYRDGVGDGQLNVVREHEVPQFYKLFSLIKLDYKPKLTYIVVQKRINTRIYMKEGVSQVSNAPPGTIMDHTITRRNWYDFFLISQNVRVGTVSPTHYVVVHDESGMPVDTVQKLSYKMTHLYYNWNGTVRVPAPCQYAHKLAYLVGQHMHAPACNNLRNVLYFL
ncbi:hypothetical protein PGB90_009167 [Kerria lacca]